MKKLPIFTAIAAAGLSVSAMAQDEQEASAPESATEQALAQQQSEEQSEEDSRLQEVTCRTEKVTGSLTRVNRICMTRAEWNRISEQTRRGADRMLRDANTNMTCQANGTCP